MRVYRHYEVGPKPLRIPATRNFRMGRSVDGSVVTDTSKALIAAHPAILVAHRRCEASQRVRTKARSPRSASRSGRNKRKRPGDSKREHLFPRRGRGNDESILCLLSNVRLGTLCRPHASKHAACASVYTFRPFRKFGSAAPGRLLAQPSRHKEPDATVTPALLEQNHLLQTVLRPAGLIVALHNENPVGFAHAGSGPN